MLQIVAQRPLRNETRRFAVPWQFLSGLCPTVSKSEIMSPMKFPNKYSINMIGFMQGRLSPIRNGRIQSFPWGHWENEFRQAEDLGFTLMEWTIDSERFSVNPLVTTDGQSDINQLSRTHGLLIPSVTCDYFMENPFWKKDVAVIRKNLISILDGMRRVGAKILVIPLVDSSSLKDMGQRDKVTDFFISLESELSDNGLQIAFESDFEPQALLEYVSNFNSKYFGINYDIGNSASLGLNPTEEFEAYGSRILNIHVKDRELGGSTVPLGEGVADFTTIFKLMKDFNYRGNLIMQTARSSEGKHAEALTKYRNMILGWKENSSHAS